MSTYVAMIRGINVTGVNVVKMERLRELIARCGFKNVRTYIQSGNVVFDSATAPTACAVRIERALTAELRKPVAVVVRSSRELAAILRANPFLKEKGIETARLHVSFLKAQPAKNVLAPLDAVKSGRDRYALRGKEVFLHTPDGFGTSKLAAALDRLLAPAATVRNWNTVTKLYEMSIM